MIETIIRLAILLLLGVQDGQRVFSTTTKTYHYLSISIESIVENNSACV